MEMRVVVPDGASSGALAKRLTAVFGERVSRRPDSREVDVRVDGESDRAVLRVFDAVEGWLDQAGIGSAEMWLEGHVYRVAGWARPDSLLAHSLTTRAKE
jgi:hypothetical protein